MKKKKANVIEKMSNKVKKQCIKNRNERKKTEYG